MIPHCTVKKHKIFCFSIMFIAFIVFSADESIYHHVFGWCRHKLYTTCTEKHQQIDNNIAKHRIFAHFFRHTRHPVLLSQCALLFRSYYMRCVRYGWRSNLIGKRKYNTQSKCSLKYILFALRINLCWLPLLHCFFDVVVYF